MSLFNAAAFRRSGHVHESHQGMQRAQLSESRVAAICNPAFQASSPKLLKPASGPAFLFPSAASNSERQEMIIEHFTANQHVSRALSGKLSTARLNRPHSRSKPENPGTANSAS
ncbi:hypothetical protein [Novosphingobium gossypii]|uniref:hypothetical protein n=1 Tax=Novosphingobium gossypii TaxID=1604774 RepID=UPI003D1B226B